MVIIIRNSIWSPMEIKPWAISMAIMRAKKEADLMSVLTIIGNDFIDADWVEIMALDTSSFGWVAWMKRRLVQTANWFGENKLNLIEQFAAKHNLQFVAEKITDDLIRTIWATLILKPKK